MSSHSSYSTELFRETLLLQPLSLTHLSPSLSRRKQQQQLLVLAMEIEVLRRDNAANQIIRAFRRQQRRSHHLNPSAPLNRNRK